MAAEFIGSTVLVTLRSPPNGQVRGVVADIIGQQLTLSDVTWLASGLRSPKFPIDAGNILDLEVAPEASPHDIHQAHPSISTPTAQASDDGLLPSPVPRTSSARVLASPTPSSHRAHQNLVDPAILSYGKIPSKTEPESLQLSPKAQQSFVLTEIPAETVNYGPNRALRAIPTELSESILSKTGQDPSDGLGITKHDSLANATLSEPFDDQVLSANLKTEDDSACGVSELGTYAENGEQAQLEHVEAPIATTVKGGKQNGKRVRRGTRGGHRMRNVGVQATAPSTQDTEGLQSKVSVAKAQKSTTASTFQSQTPLVEADATMYASPSTFRKDTRNWQEKRASRRERTKTRDAQNGWATEDATDIQEMGNFDFAGNLSKFNKHEVFSRLRRHDDTPDKARLVSHNRAPKPGTGGGKNLHWTENVLSPSHPPQSNGQGKWNSEAGESENDLSDAKTSSDRSSRRDTSRTSLRRPQSRKGSAKAGENQDLVGPRVASGSVGSVRYSFFDQVGSPRPGRNMSVSPFTGSISAPRSLFKIEGSNKTCPCLSPLQMLEFEQFAVSELGLSEDMMTENAARGIAETCLNVACSVDKVYKKRDRAPNSSIVIAVGNHKTGARAIAAGRHLRNHGFQVTVTLMGLDHEDDLLDAVRQQANAYRKNGGTLLKPTELLEGLKSKSVRPTILVDTLLGIHTCFDDLRRDDQAVYFELVIWVNRALIEVLSIDVPSGLDPSTGEITIVDDQPLALFPKTILSLGAPKTWLLATLRDRGDQDNTQLFVADIGLSNLAWKRLGKRRGGIEFGSQWCSNVRLSKDGFSPYFALLHCMAL